MSFMNPVINYILLKTVLFQQPPIGLVRLFEGETVKDPNMLKFFSKI